MDETTRNVLDLLTEDLYSLYEIGVQVPVGRHLLQTTIEEMLREGLAEWYVRANDSAPATALSQTGLSAPSLDDQDSWEPPQSESQQCLLGATSKAIKPTSVDEH
jgi:hypothetical protein